MTNPMDVRIVRPYKKTSEAVGGAVGRVGDPFLSAWVVMLLTPIATSWHPGYWAAFAAVIVVRCLMHAPTPLDRWSAPGRKPSSSLSAAIARELATRNSKASAS